MNRIRLWELAESILGEVIKPKPDLAQALAWTRELAELLAVYAGGEGQGAS